MRLAWLLGIAACGTSPPSGIPGVQLAQTEPVSQIAADDQTIVWTTESGSSSNPRETVWQLDAGASAPRTLFTGPFLDVGRAGRIVLASHQAYWEQQSDFSVRIFTSELDVARDTMLGGTSVSLVAGDGPYLVRVNAGVEIRIADPRTPPDRVPWEGVYLLTATPFAAGAGKLVLATPSGAQTIALGTGAVASFDLGGHVPQVFVPADDGFWFMEPTGGIYRVTSAATTHVVDVPAMTVTSFAALGEDLWFASGGGSDPSTVTVLVRLHADGSYEEHPVLAGLIQIVRAGDTLVAVTYDGPSTLWRVVP